MNEIENVEQFDFDFDLKEFTQESSFVPGEYEIKCLKSGLFKSKAGNMMMRTSWRILATGEMFDVFWQIFAKDKNDPSKPALSAKIAFKQIEDFTTLIGRPIEHLTNETIDSLVGGVCFAILKSEKNTIEGNKDNIKIAKFIEKQSDMPSDMPF